PGADAAGAAVVALLAGVERGRHRRARPGPGGRDRARTGAVGAAPAAAHARRHAFAPAQRTDRADALPAHAWPVRVRLRQPAPVRLPCARPARLVGAGVRGDRQAPLHHRGLCRLAAVGAAGGDFDPRLDAPAGPQLGSAAPRGVRGGSAGGAAFLVDREVGLSRAAAVCGDPGGPARLARLEAVVAPDRPCPAADPVRTAPRAAAALPDRRLTAAECFSPGRTAAAPP